MATIETQLRTNKRQLVLHDSLAFLILLAVTVVLFGITLFLFRSFSAHRTELARQAGQDGRQALVGHRPHDAIANLRTALSYAPNERDYELLLAQALGEDGHLEEAITYFLNLWESQPGDGFINLQLARLERQRQDTQHAINYYRAAIFGNWNSDGVTRRRDVRLELANYLIDQKQFALAQTELLIAASNAPSDPAISMALGDTLLRADDSADAMKQYRKAILEDPHNAIAYEKAGRLAFNLADYPRARDYLERAIRETTGALNSAAAEGDTATLLKASERLLILDPNSATNRSDRVRRILDNRSLAMKRLTACTQQLAAKSSLPNSIRVDGTQWAPTRSQTRAALLKDPALEAGFQELTNITETLASEHCGPPTGDDALLLLLAKQSATTH